MSVNPTHPSRRAWLKGSAAAALGLHLPSLLSRASTSNEFKITRAEAIGLRIPFHENVRENMLENYRRENMDRPAYFPFIVRLHTAGGLVGLGESGQDPRPHIGALKDRSFWDFFNSDPVGPAIMMAIYDLAAQTAGVPISKLFSPTPRKVIQHVWWSHCLRPALMRSEAKRGVDLGYMIQKVKARQYEEPAEQIAAMAEVVPHDYTIYMDANGSFGSPGRTLAVAESLKPLKLVKGFEQPIAHEDVAGYRQIRKSLPLRLAVHWEAVDTRSFMFESICDAFVVEDWKWGPALASKSERCKINGQKLWVENGLFTGISQVFQAHQCAALPNVEFIISLTHVAEDDIVIEPFKVEKGGFYKIPEKPGLGVTLDEPALEKYRIH